MNVTFIKVDFCSILNATFFKIQINGPAVSVYCTTIPRYPFFSMKYAVVSMVYTGYHGTSEMEHGLCFCTLGKARGLSLRTGAQTMLYLSRRVQEYGVAIYTAHQQTLQGGIIRVSQSPDWPAERHL